MGPSDLTVGYACSWWHPREPTWSYTAVRLRAALARHAAGLVDLEVQRSLAGKAVLKALCAPFGAAWQYCALEDRLADRRLEAGVRRTKPDAILAIGDTYPHARHRPFLYQDMNLLTALEHDDRLGSGVVNLAPGRRRSTVQRAALRRCERYEGASVVFAMSSWFARILEEQGIPASKVQVVRGGINNVPSSVRDPNEPSRGRVLFVGTDFTRKGGDLVLSAVDRIRRSGAVDATLTIAGPSTWPLASAPPPWVRFLGEVSGERVAALYAEHDLFALPSRFEAYGIVFLEARAAGLPCIGRDAYAMPELLPDDGTARLVRSDDPDSLANQIVELLDDPTVHQRVALGRDRLLETFSWDRAACEILDRMGAETAST